MNQFQTLFVFSFILIASGCINSSGGAFTGEDLKATVIFTSPSCEGLGQSPGATWINNANGLLSIMNKINRLKIGGSSTPLPVIDYDHEGVLLIMMGRRPTGGYRIELASEKVSMKDQTAVVKVNWIEPPKDAILTQAITSPCIMVKLAKAGFSKIEVMDQNGIVRAETEVKTWQQ